MSSKEGGAWKETLHEHFGKPTKNSNIESQNKGEKYSTIFERYGEECKIFITFYRPTKKLPRIQTILIQTEGKKQSFAISFIDSIFPKLYKDVKRKLEMESKPNLRKVGKISYKELNETDSDEEDEQEIIEDRSSKVKSTKRKNSALKINCRYCNFVTDKRRTMALHTKKNHSSGSSGHTENKCPFCKKDIEKNDSVTNHVKVYHIDETDFDAMKSNLSEKSSPMPANTEESEAPPEIDKRMVENECKALKFLRFNSAKESPRQKEKTLDTDLSSVTIPLSISHISNCSLEVNLEPEKEKGSSGKKKQCHLCMLEVSSEELLSDHLEGSHGIHMENECRKCKGIQERNMDLAKEAVEEKTKRILLEADIDVKRMHQTKTNVALTKCKQELAVLKDSREKETENMTKKLNNAEEEVKKLKEELSKMKESISKKERNIKTEAI